MSPIDTEPTLVRGAVSVGMGRERRLLWLLAARLVTSGVCLGIAIGLDALGRSLPEEARSGLYWTVAVAFLATAVSGLLTRGARVTQRFVDGQIVVDVVVVSGLVHFAGAHESLFTFLYVLVTLYSAVLFGRKRALFAASASAIGYGAVLAWAAGTPGAPSNAMLAALWAIHVGALFLVGALASTLSGELQRTGAALDRSTSDLRRLRDLHRHTVESLMSGLLTTDSQGRVTSFNPEAERITGAATSSVVGRDLDDVLPGTRALVMDSRAGARPGGPRLRMAYRNVRGEDLHLGLAGSVLRGDHGEPSGFVVIFQDVTDVVGMENELRRSERLAAVGEMAANMAHEVRNPLAAISGAIEILRSDVAGKSSGAEMVQLMDIAVRETERLDALIADFLTYARPAPLEREQVQLDDVVAELAALFEPSKPANVCFETQTEPELRVLADPRQLRQLLWNLCLNASQAMEQGGTLRVEARRVAQAQARAAEGRHESRGGTPPQAVELVVSDTGPGIPEELRAQIFEPFFTTRKEGSGLGLALVHRIVEAHGGSLQLQTGDGGTRFHIRLPAVGDGA